MRRYIHLLAACWLPCSFAESQKVVGLEAYVGQDLRKLQGTSLAEFTNELRQLTGDPPEEATWASVSPWWLSSFRVGAASWVLFEAYPGMDIPDWSHVRVQIFDQRWNRLLRQSFPTGYRLYLRRARVVECQRPKQHFLVTEVTSAHPAPELARRGDGRICRRQHYALLGTALAMVRLEDGQGRLVRNSYGWGKPCMGPPVPDRTEEEWMQSLRSSDVVELLASLVWLTGRHLPSATQRTVGVSQEPVERSRCFESVRDDPRTHRILRVLEAHRNPWVREYARLGISKPQP